MKTRKQKGGEQIIEAIPIHHHHYCTRHSSSLITMGNKLVFPDDISYVRVCFPRVIMYMESSEKARNEKHSKQKEDVKVHTYNDDTMFHVDAHPFEGAAFHRFPRPASNTPFLGSLSTTLVSCRELTRERETSESTTTTCSYMHT